MSINCWRSTSGSSDKFASCSRVSVVPNDDPRGSAAAACLSWPTSTVSLWPSIGSIRTCLLLPLLHADVGQHARFKSREFGLHRIPSRRKFRDGRDALIGRLHRLDRRRFVRGLDPCDRDGGAGQHRARGIHDGDDERAGLRGCLRSAVARARRWSCVGEALTPRQIRSTSVTIAERIMNLTSRSCRNVADQPWR